MKQSDVTRLEAYAKKRTGRSIRSIIIVGLSCLVLLVTLSVMILPANTAADGELTQTEQTQVDEVIAMIEAIPSASEIDETIAGYASVFDYMGEENYINGTYAQINDAYAAYSALSESMQSSVTNSDKLMELEHIWSAAAMAEGEEDTDTNKGMIKDKLDGDYAYISNLWLDDKVSGAWDGDDNDEPGNDSSQKNDVILTFDTAIYTLGFETALRNEVLNDNIGGYSYGRLYFEFILPLTEEEAIFETDSMGWLRTNMQPTYTYTVEEIGGKTVQVLRGSFMMQPTTDNPAAISPGKRTLDIVIRTKIMKNGEEVEPQFTLWLDYNKVGAEYTKDANGNPYHTNIVTGNGTICNTVDEKAPDSEEERVHGREAATLTPDPLKISAAPNYNVQVISGMDSNTTVDTFDFSDAPNRMDLQVYGRIMGFGFLVEMRANGNKMLRGVEFPDENTPIEFTVDFSTGVTDSDGYHDLNTNYPPLVYGYTNNTRNGYTGGRDPKVSATYINNAPWSNVSSSGSVGTSCYDGGDWAFSLDPNDPTKVHISITGFQVDLSKMPNATIADGSTYMRYYDRETVGTEYWKINRAVFSVGGIFVVQPYERPDGLKVDENGESTDIRDKYADGTARLTAALVDHKVTMQSISGQMEKTNVMIDDDIARVSFIYSRPGTINTFVYYVQYETDYTPLTDGASQNQTDWAIAGQNAAIQSVIHMYGAEGDYRGVGYDLLLKFDDAFFEAEKYRMGSPITTAETSGKGDWTALWAAKPNGKGWDHGELKPDEDGYDNEMMQANVDDLVYYESLDALRDDNAVCVGLLLQYRGICGDFIGQYRMYVDGRIKSEGTTGNVYMAAFASRAWRMLDVEEDLREKYGLAADVNITNKQYIEYAKTYLPDWSNQTRGKELVSYSDYADPYYIESYDYTTDAEDPENNLHQTAQKATYSDAGVFLGSSGDYRQIDSCLVVPYATEITKTTAQTVTDGKNKTEYEMAYGQKVVDYMLSPKARRIAGVFESTDGASLVTTVYIEDTIPAGLEFIPGSIFWEGQNGSITYTQDPLWQKQGTIVGGIAPVSHPDDPDQPWFELVVESGENGTTILKITLHNVTVDANEVTDFGQIYYSCTISDSVPRNTTLENTVKIWSTEDHRMFSAANKNLTTWRITVLRTVALSISKISDLLVGELWDDLGFSMNVGNNSGSDLTDVVVAESLPFNGMNQTVFNGRLVVSEFSAGTLNATTNATLMSGLKFYYTTDQQYAGKRAIELASGDFTEANGWYELSAATDQNTAASGLPLTKFVLPDAEEQGDWGKYEDSENYRQITAIVAVGSIPAGETLKLHITLNLPEGQANDYLINYLSLSEGNSDLSTYARTQIVSRTLEGLTWMDINQNGIQDEEESNLMSGVKVSLLKLENGAYVPYCYPNTDTPVVIHTGESVSVLDQTTVSEYESGRYLFTDLPSGTFAVRFESGEESQGGYDIANLIATAVDAGSDDQLDSDGIASYEGTTLLSTQISGIEMKPARDLTYGKVESKYHDSGFHYRGYELPGTGSMGTAPIYLIGGLLVVLALGGYMLIKRKRNDL